MFRTQCIQDPVPPFSSTTAGPASPQRRHAVWWSARRGSKRAASASIRSRCAAASSRESILTGLKSIT